MRWKLTIHYKNKPSEISYFQEGTHTVFVKLDLVEDDAIKFELEKKNELETEDLDSQNVVHGRNSSQ